MDASRIDRINELYHKSQSVGLTEEEKEEQARLTGTCGTLQLYGEASAIT